jgi:hypothetical protein
MKSLAVAVAVLAWAAQAAAPHAQGPAPTQPPAPDLRQALQQARGTAPAPLPRQLTPPERAELRRQLSEYAQPPIVVPRR